MKTKTSEEKEIAKNHKADVAGGLTEEQASESDAYERRVLGAPDPGEEQYD